jgi:DNA-binding transcriptional ArsR family regulator
MARHAAYRAIADPTRRRILDLLRDRGPQRAGDIAAAFPRISRPAVSRHLRILRRARLVRETARGRERWYRLDARPLRELYDSWLGGYAAFWEDRLRTLKRIAEAEARRRREERTDGRDRDPTRDRDRGAG